MKSSLVNSNASQPGDAEPLELLANVSVRTRHVLSSKEANIGTVSPYLQ